MSLFCIADRLVQRRKETFHFPSESDEVIVIHQDSFAADYQDEEYTLFGKAMKFAGIYGKEIRIIGKNRETLSTAKAAPVQ